ncbi:DUF3261 domain-containing protein [Orbus mooreae]|uniref:DUF3261 domain-containing protein n=1 Tax=Orbus mooreae TaxID=3074107 RepID=UPI00370D0221
MKSYLFLMTSFLVILLTACAKPSTSATETWLTKETKVNLPSPILGQTYHDQQLLTFNYNGQQNSLIVLVDVNNDTLNVVGLSTLGIRLFKIEYHDNVITTEQYIFIKELPPASQILSDIMLSIYPIQTWLAVLPAKWQLVDDKYHRKLLNDKHEIVIDITYQKPLSSQIRKPSNIEHKVFNYQIAIESME